MNGAESLFASLAAEQVELIFGYPGGSLLYVYDALDKQDAIKHVLVRHEQSGVHAADAYARASGKVGVCLVTSGPGVTNAVTGIATAFMDSIPLVIVCGQVGTASLGQDAFQEVDTVGITRPCVKHNFLVTDVDAIPAIVKKAFYIARTGRPGPVLIDLPKDLSGAARRTPFVYPEQVALRSYIPVTSGHAGQIKKAAAIIGAAERPLIYAGGGIVLGEASAELRELAALLGAPVTNTLMGLGSYPARDPQFLGMLGMHGTFEANMAMQNCDVLIAVGARFDDRVIGNTKDFHREQRKIIHIDIDPTSIAKRVKVNVPIIGDVKAVLPELLARVRACIPDRAAYKARLAPWWTRIREWRAVQCLAYEREGGAIKPQYVLEALANLAGSDDFIVTSDVGQHQMWAAQYLKFAAPRKWINSGGLGTMGFGLPAAIGAQLAHPGKTVFCITGDGSIQMSSKELSTCRQYGLPIKIVCLNNGYLGMVRQQQELFHGNRESSSYINAMPDFVKLAQAYGHVGRQVRHAGDVTAALTEAVAMKDELVFLDFLTSPLEGVFPMIASGSGLEQMIMRPEKSVCCD